jgi:hypothetical protein
VGVHSRCLQAHENRKKRCLLCHAEKDDKKKNLNWDDAWSSFKRGAGLDGKDNFTDKPSSPGQNLPRSQQNLRKQESLLLNIVSNQLFFLVAGSMVFVLLLGILGSAAPRDPRCSLPWC